MDHFSFLLSFFEMPFSSPLTFIVVALASLILSYLVSEWFREKPFKEPGLRLPFIGHLYLFDFRNLAWELERLRGEEGEQIMGVWLGTDYMVYITSPELTHLVFAKHGDKSSGRSVYMPPELSLAEKRFGSQRRGAMVYKPQVNFKGIDWVQSKALANRPDIAGKGMELRGYKENPYKNEILFESIQGGLDTTTAMIEWCLAYLADTPEFQEKIHQEMDDICDPAEGPQRDQQNSLVLLNAAILETLRIAQISSVVVPHKATEDIDLGEGRGVIPEGAALLWYFKQLHGDQKLWPDPFVFRPERFLAEEETGLTATLNSAANPNRDVDNQGRSKKYLPFAIGPRHCPGFRLANYELYICLSKLLWEFQFSSKTKIDSIITPTPFQ